MLYIHILLAELKCLFCLFIFTFVKVHFFLKRREGNLSDVEVSRLNSWALGLRVLAALPLPWQQRCSSLHEHPHLILEVLLMRKQLQSAALVRYHFLDAFSHAPILDIFCVKTDLNTI